jgi:acetoin utilization protein AcuC
MCSTAVFYGEALSRYGFGGSHPLGQDRIYAFWSRFQDAKLDTSDQVAIQEPALADEQTILGFHEKEYVEFVKKASVSANVMLDRGDTPAFKGVFEASCYVVGSTLAAVDQVMAGKDKQGRVIQHAFNPIGGLHHARRDTAGGFCVFNDIGVAIYVLRKKYQIGRIAYIDIDAHHGDGVFYEFESDPLLFIGDIHESGEYLYPGTGSAYETGSGKAEGTKLNIPLEPGSTDQDFMAAFDRIEKFIDAARPEFIILQCGADGLRGDPITHLGYTTRAHRHAADSLHRLAHKHCKGRIIALGGGGYNRKNIGEAWVQVVESFIDSPR